MNNLIYEKELIENIVKNSISNKEIYSKLGIKGWTTKVHLRKFIKENNIDTSHIIIDRKAGNRGLSDNEIFILNSPVAKASLRYRILRDNLLKYECQLCGNKGIWLNQKRPLIIDHIDGNNLNDKLCNLRWLCSNCDSIQITYKGRNRQKIDISIVENKVRAVLLAKQKREKNKEDQIKNKLNLITHSKINFNKSGWRIELSKILNISPQASGNFVKKHAPEIYKISWKHKDRI